MSEIMIKQYLFASDFDQTLSFNDSGLVLTELLGIPIEEFKEKAAGMAELNLVQQGAELAYLLLHDPTFSSRVRREHLIETGKRIPLKENIQLLYHTFAKASPATSSTFAFSPPRQWRSCSRRSKGLCPPITSTAPNSSGDLTVQLSALFGALPDTAR